MRAEPMRDKDTLKMVSRATNGREGSLSLNKLTFAHTSVPYWLGLPQQPDASRVLLLLHGISRNAREMAQAFLPAATKAGYTVLAPVFDAGHCPDFQRLGRWGKGPRIDFILQSLLEQLGSRLQEEVYRVDLFGYSAGAQLAHRFAMARPQRLRKLALGAAGWYTMPTADRYPRGLRLKNELPGVRFVPEHFLRIPTRVYVGEEDTAREKTLNTNRRIDRQQGLNRLQRAETWVRHMNQKANDLRLPASIELHIMPGVGHSFRQSVERYCLTQAIMGWLLEQPPVQLSQKAHEVRS